MTNASLFFFFPFIPIGHPHPPSIAAFLIGTLSMAKVGIVGQRAEPKPEEVTIELGQR